MKFNEIVRNSHRIERNLGKFSSRVLGMPMMMIIIITMTKVKMKITSRAGELRRTWVDWVTSAACTLLW